MDALADRTAMSGKPGARGDSQTRQDVGLCSTCLHGRMHANARGSAFWRCGRSDSDARFARYPSLPVLACEGFGPTGEGC